MSKTVGRRLYSIKESYVITYLAFRSMPKLLYVKKHNLLSQQFIERIMLSVTEVNGCDICSYVHTKIALEAGMTNEEIQKMLGGIIDDVPLKEVHGIMYGQHYANARGNPGTDTWNQLNSVYNKDTALGILAATRVIMFGNAYGIPWSSFSKRIKGKADQRISLGYELSILLGSFIMIPIGGLHALFVGLMGIPYINFTDKTD